MAEASNVDTADRLSRRRARQFPLLAALYFAHQAALFVVRPEMSARTVDYAILVGWTLLSLVLLGVLVSGGWWFVSREVRALMNDEVALANRATAMRTGFLAAMLAAIALTLLSFFDPIGSWDSLRIVLAVGLGAALVHFGALERRALEDG